MVRSTTRPALTTPLMAIASALLVLPYAVYLMVVDTPSAVGWGFIAATIVLHIWYFSSLGYAYASGELSVVYPIARGLGLSIIPILGVSVLGETMSLPAIIGAASIVTGIICVMLSDIRFSSIQGYLRGVLQGQDADGVSLLRQLIAKPSIPLALATGIVIGIYSVVDKQGVQHVQPALYMFWLQLGGGLGMMALMSRFERRAAFISEFQKHWKVHIFGGLLQFAAYAMVLTALQVSPVSYVGPFREVAVLFGVILGYFALKERVNLLRAAGAVLIASGGITIALAP